METTTLKSLSGPVMYWYIKLLSGIIFIIVGIWALATSTGAYIALSLLFGISFLITGILQIIFAISNRKVITYWRWKLAIGIFELLVGILLLANPGLFIVGLPLYVGFVLLFRSFSTMRWAFLLHKLLIKHWGWVLAIGNLELIFAIALGAIFFLVLLWELHSTGYIVVIITGIAFLLTGSSQIFLSSRLKGLNKRH